MRDSKKYGLLFLFFFISGHVNPQLLRGADAGFNVGVISALGNRFQRLGLTLQAWGRNDFAQLNTEFRIYRSFKNLGPSLPYNELVASAGLVLGYGAIQKEDNPFVSIVSNQTHYKNSVGYSYNLYFNRIRTTQQTGIIAVQINGISFISENDIFARPTLDRFRTGAVLVQYQYKNLYQYAINCTLWTGQLGNRVAGTGLPYPCYMDTTNGLYTNYSHGLLSGQFKMALNYGQALQANAGIDAEQVRDFIQNYSVHNAFFLPRKWRGNKNCAIPMLDVHGHQYLRKPGQQIRPAKPYWNIFTSPATFY